MPELRAREQSVRAERQAILDQAADQISFLRLAETLTAFLQRLRQSAETLEMLRATPHRPIRCAAQRDNG